MAFVYVPRDLSKVKQKFLFNLTLRQIICFALAAAMGVPAYLFTRASLGNTLAALLMIVLMLPCFLFALYEKNGQKAEKILGNIIRTMFIYPKVRKYGISRLFKP